MRLEIRDRPMFIKHTAGNKASFSVLCNYLTNPTTVMCIIDQNRNKTTTKENCARRPDSYVIIRLCNNRLRVGFYDEIRFSGSRSNIIKATFVTFCDFRWPRNQKKIFLTLWTVIVQHYNNYLPQRLSLCLLFVSLLAILNNYAKTSRLIFTKFSKRVTHGPRPEGPIRFRC